MKCVDPEAESYHSWCGINLIGCGTQKKAALGAFGDMDGFKDRFYFLLSVHVGGSALYKPTLAPSKKKQPIDNLRDNSQIYYSILPQQTSFRDQIEL